MRIPNTDAMYFFVENGIAKRIDSMFVNYLHQQGKVILKKWLDEHHTEEWLQPDEEIPEDYIQESPYGMCMLIQEGEEDE